MKKYHIALTEEDQHFWGRLISAISFRRESMGMKSTKATDNPL
jgi:hypothetical protein